MLLKGVLFGRLEAASPLSAPLWLRARPEVLRDERKREERLRPVDPEADLRHTSEDARERDTALVASPPNSYSLGANTKNPDARTQS